MKNLFINWISTALVMVMACGAGHAADDTALVSMNLKDADVRAAIESLFRGTGKNFAIEPDVSGVIPDVSFKDVKFEVALRTLVKTAGCVYRVDGDIYLISKKSAAATTPPAATQEPADTATVDETKASETIIDKVNLLFMSPGDMLSIMSGNSNNNRTSTTGMSGGMNGMSGMSGMGSMSGMTGMSGMSGLSGLSSSYGSSLGTTYGGTSNYSRSW